MADILIRMEMPEDCDKCKLCALIPVGMYGLYRKCTPLNRNAKITVRRKDCPLHELPEHGRLIDADSLTDDLLYDVELAERALDDTSLVGKEREYAQSEKDIKQNCAYYVSHAPVIVPSNKEDAE